MFRIGEFSQIARVSGRLLRYYDSIGLLRPDRIDPVTGYRYYSAGQLARLNRILALKDLGLSLEQVARLLDDKISPDEIRGMLTLKKAELERTLSEEAARLRHIDSRLRQIEEQGSLANYDVLVKSAPAQPYLAARATFPQIGDVITTLRQVVRAAGKHASAPQDNLVVVAHSDFEDENLDLEIGYALGREARKAVPLSPQITLTMRELPAVPTLATVVRSGPAPELHLAFGALGTWMEANHYRVAGPCREVFLEPPFQTPGSDHVTVEIQFPVSQAT
jgi:DNA-binding transcriptional MerR regulator